MGNRFCVVGFGYREDGDLCVCAIGGGALFAAYCVGKGRLGAGGTVEVEDGVCTGGGGGGGGIDDGGDGCAKCCCQAQGEYPPLTYVFSIVGGTTG